ncbi:SGNH/GDSL hydrolase family protein [Nocardioides maradonensis]
MRRTRTALAAVALLTGLGLTACGPAPSRIPLSSTGLSGNRYVSLGDSYTAAPSIAGGPARGDDGCGRSARNYPHLVADALALRLEDVSCGGATTAQMLQEQKLGSTVVPPQLDALRPDTSLVTLGIGGNDDNVFAQLITSCVGLGMAHPQGSPCADSVKGGIEKALTALQRRLAGRVEAVVGEIEQRSPKARVLLIGYPQIVPASGTCPQLPLAAGDYPYARRVIASLNTALRRAAAARHVTYVDVWTATAGHDICAADPWIAGSQTTEPGFIYHPYAEEQQAVADQVEATLRG